MCRWLKTKPRAIYRILHSAAAIRSRRVVLGRSKAYREAYGYLRDHIKHLDYVRYRRNHLPIGSGVTEAACKTVFSQRLKRSGMAWSVEGGQRIVDLRVIHLSGVWSEVHQSYLQSKRLPEMPNSGGFREEKPQKSRIIPGMGAIAPLKEIDPYRHLTSVHGHADYKFRTSPWSDFAMYQSWDEGGGHDFLLKMRRAQAATGRPMPQVNEEYGYEDHYPTRWGGGRKAPARSADNRRRLAWGMYMAGGYQTTGERADRGTGKGPDSGGGWINGRGDEAMTMLEGYAHIVECFTGLEWWRMDPHDELVTGGAYCLAEPGRQYLVYLPEGGRTTLKLAEGRYRASWFDPRTGKAQEIGVASGPEWSSPPREKTQDWAIILRRR